VSNERLRGLKPSITRVILLVTSYSLLVTLIGCEAFVRKFTRKPKKENMPQEQMVIAPEEYKPPIMTKEEKYREYFLYWKSWHDELIESLSSSTNSKRQISCSNEAIKNLEEIRMLLNAEKQKELDVWINQLKDLRDEISSDVYGTNAVRNRGSAERIRRNIMQDFSYPKVKDYLA
jgi:hypothetical protein